MSRSDLKINASRLIDELKTIRRFTDTPGDGVTRFSYGKQDIAVRKHIIDQALESGCSVGVDEIGNIRIGLGSNAPGKPVILCGSHIDTVRNGGWLDGINGVCSAIEVLRTLSEGVFGTFDEDSREKSSDEDPTSCNFEVIIFAEEEGSNFGSTMTGSKFITGVYSDKDLDKLKDAEGRTMREVLERFAGEISYDPRVDVSMKTPWDLSDAKAMIELHIEQGPVLERKQLPIGIVDNIFGMRVIEVRINGVGNHAGATPMSERYDALSTAAECILAAEKTVKADPEEKAVVTAGRMELAPNCSNVIPETVIFSLEVRDRDEGKINKYMDMIIDEIKKIAKDRRVKCEVTEHSGSSPLKLSGDIAARISKAADRTKIPHQVMDSGAVHDACMIAQAGVPTGMIFVPSKDGRSHVPEEDTDQNDLITGAQLLLDVILDLMAA